MHTAFRGSNVGTWLSAIPEFSIPKHRLCLLALVLFGIATLFASTPAAHAQSEAAASMQAAASRSCGPPSEGTQGPLCSVAHAPESVLLSMAPIQFAVFNTLAIQSNQQFQAVIRDRVDDLQEGKPGDVVLRQTRQAPYAMSTLPAKSYKSGGGASADQTSGTRWGTFLTALGARGDQDPTSRQEGFDSTVYGLIGGVDYRFTPSFVLGGALGYERSRSSFDFNTGSIVSDSYTGSGFFNWSAERGWYVDGLVTYSLNRYDNTRNFTDPSNILQTATSKPNGDRLNALAILGYSIYRGPYTFAPFVSVNFIDQHIDSFAETGAGTFNLNAASQTQISLTSGVGVQANRAFSRSWGVLSLGGRAEWKHEFQNDSAVLPMTFQVDPVNGTFFVPTDVPDRNYFILGINAAAQFAAGKSAFLQYETVLGLQNVTNNVVTVGFRLDF